MDASLIICVGLIGGAGAICRVLLDGGVSARLSGAFPFGTLTVNVGGAFLLGLLAGVAVSADTYRLAGTAFLGSFTTFSTWMLESQRLGEEGRLPLVALNLAVSLVLGLGAAVAGRAVGDLL